MLPVTPQPRCSVAAMRFNRNAGSMSVSLSCRCRKVVAPRIELSTTRVSGGFGRPALDYHVKKSDTSESNRDPPAPKAGVLPSAPVSDVVFVFAADDPVGAYLPCQWASYHPMWGLILSSPAQSGHEKRPDVCVTSCLDERRFETSRRHMRKRYAGALSFDGVPPKSLPSHICSSRLDWNFDNMELSARL